jgi:hypothetical protein
VADRKPKPSRADDIRTHDIVTDGLPDLRTRWPDVRLVYLDPPYWWQAKGQYSNDATDLANMPLDEFNAALASIVNGFAEKMHKGHIALIIQPTQWNAPDRKYTDHVTDMVRVVDLPIAMRIQAPYSSQQATPQMVDWAKTNRKILVLSREIVVWTIGK